MESTSNKFLLLTKPVVCCDISLSVWLGGKLQSCQRKNLLSEVDLCMVIVKDEKIAQIIWNSYSMVCDVSDCSSPWRSTRSS